VDEEVRECYKTLLSLRKADETLIYGDFKVLNRKKNRFTYARSLNGRRYIIDCNLGTKPQKAYVSKGEYELVYTTEAFNEMRLGAYEARIWRKI